MSRRYNQTVKFFFRLNCIKYCKTVRIKQHGISKRYAINPCAEPEMTCTTSAPYRSYDGSCNNLAHPVWGAADGLQNRIVPNKYDDSMGHIFLSLNALSIVKAHE